MASQVPYNPVPNVAAVDRPTPYRSEAIPSGAFGQPQALARQQEGATMAKVGDELYARAIALQQFNEEAHANELDAAFQQQQIKAFTEFSQSMGKNAVDGLPVFLAQQEQIRQQMGAGLSPYGMQLYNNQTRNAYNRIAVSAGFHANQQSLKYNIGALDAQADAASSSVRGNPTQQNFDAAMAAKEKAIRDKGLFLGQSQEEIEQNVVAGKSDLAYDQVMGKANSGRYLEADKLREKYAAGSLIDAKTNDKLIAHLRPLIDGQQTRVTAADMAAGTAGKWDGKDYTPQQLRIAVKGTEGGIYDKEGSLVKKGLYAGQQALGAYQVMPGNLAQWLREAGMPAMTPAEFLKNPAAQDQLFDIRFGGYVKKYGLDGALSMWFTGRPDSSMDESDGFHTKAWYLATAHAALYHNMGENERKAFAGQIADEQRPNDNLYKSNLQARVLTDFAIEQREQRIHDLENEQTLNTAMIPQGDGKLITDPSQLAPDAKRAYDNSKHQKHWDDMMHANAKMGGYRDTPETIDTYYRLKGIAENSERSPEEAEELLTYDPKDHPMSAQTADKILKLKGQILNGMESPLGPKVNAAMRYADPELREAGIGIGSDQNKDLRDRFRGALSETMHEWTLENKRPPNEEEAHEIVQRLLVTNTDTRLPMYEGGKQRRLFGYGLDWFGKPMISDFGAPEGRDRDVIVQQYKAMHQGNEPSQAYIDAAWVARQYQKHYGRHPENYQ